MDAIHRHVIFEVLKFIPYENAKKLLTTHKSWLAPLTAQLEKQKKAMTVEIASLEESYRTFRTLQLECKERYVNLENQITGAGFDLYLQISNRQTTIAPSLRHAQNVQSISQLIQGLQNRRPDFDAASLELSDITAKVEALLLKLNGLKETLGIKVEKSAEERELAVLEKAKKYHQDIPQQISWMNAIPYTLLMDELEKQPKAITHEIERLEESYRALRTLQIQCRERYVGLEDQIKSAGSNLQLQISGHQTTIAPSQRHPQNVHSLNQTLQQLQDLRPNFNAASSDLSDVTAKVKALLRKLNAMRETMGLKPEKSAEEREIDELEKKKRFHQVRVNRLAILEPLAITSLFVTMFSTLIIMLVRFYDMVKKNLH